MPNEIELKARVADLAAVREKLVSLGAASSGSAFEHNEVFDTPQGHLRGADSLLRLRRDGRNVLTYKGPRESKDSPVKNRVEIETQVSDYAAAAAIIEALGYVRVWTYEKRRETWRLGGVEVVLDTLPEIGTYIEIEGSSEDECLDALARLGVDRAAVTPRTYAELFREHIRQTGGKPGDMVF